MNKNIRDRLVNTSSPGNLDHRQTQCLEIYKLYVEMADRISSRRQSANSFFLTLSTAIVGLVGFLGIGSWIISVAGIFISYIWYRLIRSYRGLNTGKFSVIHEMEKDLPLSVYAAEWEALGCGNNSKLYLPFTRIEVWVPGIFAGLHILALFNRILSS